MREEGQKQVDVVGRGPQNGSGKSWWGPACSGGSRQEPQVVPCCPPPAPTPAARPGAPSWFLCTRPAQLEHCTLSPRFLDHARCSLPSALRFCSRLGAPAPLLSGVASPRGQHTGGSAVGRCLWVLTRVD